MSRLLKYPLGGSQNCTPSGLLMKLSTGKGIFNLSKNWPLFIEFLLTIPSQNMLRLRFPNNKISKLNFLSLVTCGRAGITTWPFYNQNGKRLLTFGSRSMKDTICHKILNIREGNRWWRMKQVDMNTYGE